MGIGDKLSDAAGDAVEKAGGADKVKEHIGKAGDAADSATGGKFDEQIDKGKVAARSAVDKVSKKNKKKS